ncbi:S-layer homology domain-containing protein [uncultured Intestinimonas sp.]|uniref:S-layer homology domain-containing protein n=1 Tax=uncultured Intestinimonas sp. TaxID=1689265 RepID=UPI0025E46485|nr:S-layer homology domain-containing protein [uncultured Intestinimonas sp.]
MRNLKRALSLALALVMVLSMMVVGAGAVSVDDFSDADEIVNKEAVTVLATLNVITGKDDGTYDPTGTITRAEMATIICRVLNGGSDPVLGESVTDSYTDTSSHWAKAYIEYCTTLGIVSGKGDGTFDPDGEVTVAEAAKMVLVALGYNASIESYTGANWQINVDARATPLGLYDDMSYSNTSAALTRDNAAQMLYNALDCDMVEYEYVLDTTSSTITGSTQLKSDSTLGTLLEEKFNAVKVEGIVVANEVANLTSSGHLNEERTRILVTNYEDQEYYGAAANDDGIYTRTVDFSVTTGMNELGRKVFFYVEKESTSTNAEVLGSVILSDENRVVTSYSADPFTDIADDNNLDLVTSGDEATQVARNYNNAEDIDDNAQEYDEKTVKGTEKIFIDNDDDSEVEYIIVNTYRFGKVTSYVSSGDGSITVNYGTDGTFTADDADDVVGFEDVSRDDYVIAIEVGGDLYVELADTITGTMDGYDTTTDINGDSKISKLTVDDEDYDVSLVGGYTGGSDDIKAARDYGEEYLDSEATFYLTKGGFIAAVGEGDGSAYKYALVLATGNSGLEDHVRVALSDGSTGTYTVDDNSPVDERAAEIGTVYRYTLNSSDEIRLTEIDADNQDSLTDASFEQDRTAIRGNGGDKSAYYATSSTAFFYVGVEDIHGYADNERIDTDDVDIYTGYRQAPDLDDGDIYADIYVRGDEGSTQVGAVVFYGSDSLSSADMDDSIYITDIIRRTTDYTVVEAYIAGEAELQQVNIDSSEDPQEGYAYTYTINSDGYYELDDLTAERADTEDKDDGVDGRFEVETASSSTFVSENGDEYVITSETLLVDDSSYLDDPTAELGAGPYENDYVTWVTYNSDNEAILVVISNSSSTGGSGGSGSSSGSDSTTRGDATLKVEGDDLTAEDVRIASNGNLSYTFGVPASLAADGDTVSYSYAVYIDDSRVERGTKTGEVIDGEVDGTVADLAYDEGDDVEIIISNVTKEGGSSTEDETYTLTLGTDLGTNVRVWIDDGNTRIVATDSNSRGDVYNVPQDKEVLITGANGIGGEDGLAVGSVFEQNGVVFTVTDEGITFTMSGNITLSSIPTSQSYAVTLDGEVIGYISDDNATISGLTPNTGYLADTKTRASVNFTADADGEYTFSNVKARDLYTAYEVTLPDGTEATLSDGETTVLAYVASGETITFTLNGSYSINGVGDDYNNQEVTLTVDEDITVAEWESEETFQENLADAIDEVGFDEDGVKEATGATLKLEGNTLTVTITAKDVSGTGTMDLVSTLVDDHGYTVTVTKNGDTYTLTGVTDDDKETVEALLPGNNGSTTLTVTVSNGSGATAQYSVVVNVAITGA